MNERTVVIGTTIDFLCKEWHMTEEQLLQHLALHWLETIDIDIFKKDEEAARLKSEIAARMKAVYDL